MRRKLYNSIIHKIPASKTQLWHKYNSILESSLPRVQISHSTIPNAHLHKKKEIMIHKMTEKEKILEYM